VRIGAEAEPRHGYGKTLYMRSNVEIDGGTIGADRDPAGSHFVLTLRQMPDVRKGFRFAANLQSRARRHANGRTSDAIGGGGGGTAAENEPAHHGVGARARRLPDRCDISMVPSATTATAMRLWRDG